MPSLLVVKKGEKTWSASDPSMPHPWSRTAMRTQAPRREASMSSLRRSGGQAAHGVDPVAGEVEDHLLEEHRIAVDRRKARLHGHAHAHAVAPRLQVDQRAAVLEQGAHLHRHALGLLLPHELVHAPDHLPRALRLGARLGQGLRRSPPGARRPSRGG